MGIRVSKKKKTEEAGAGDWALSYGDMMTLLLTFFILIVSFSTVELDKVRRFLSSLRGASGILGEYDGSSVVEQQAKFQKVTSLEQEVLEEIIEGTKEERHVKLSDQPGVVLERTSEGVMVRINNPVLFAPGDDRINPAMYKTLRKIAFYIQQFDCRVRIEGHTDDRPIRSPRFPTNWDLSSARAISVLRFFSEQCGVNPKRLEAIGYGDTRPLVPNDSEEHRRMNRRVDIYLDWDYKSGKDLLEERNKGADTRAGF